MTDCQWTEIAEGVRCEACGTIRPLPVRRNCRPELGPSPIPAYYSRPPSTESSADAPEVADVLVAQQAAEQARQAQREERKLLGDKLEGFFAEHGITPESYQAWKREHGVDAILGAGCGCDKRKELLNKADAAVRGGAAKLRAFMGW